MHVFIFMTTTNIVTHFTTSSSIIIFCLNCYDLFELNLDPIVSMLLFFLKLK